MSFTDTEAIFEVTQVLSESVTNVKVLTDEGYPDGSEIQYSLDFKIVIDTITPSTGSSAGTTITISGSGFGVNSSFDILVWREKLCQPDSVVFGSGTIACTTNAFDIDSSDIFSVEGVLNSVDAEVSAQYTQTEMFTITAAEIDGNTITFTGTGFPTDFSMAAGVVLGTTHADSAVILSETSL